MDGLDEQAQRFARILADPMKSLFFQKIERGEMDGKANKKLFDLFQEEGKKMVRPGQYF